MFRKASYRKYLFAFLFSLIISGLYFATATTNIPLSQGIGIIFGICVILFIRMERRAIRLSTAIWLIILSGISFPIGVALSTWSIVELTDVIKSRVVVFAAVLPGCIIASALVLLALYSDIDFNKVIRGKRAMTWFGIPLLCPLVAIPLYFLMKFPGDALLTEDALLTFHVLRAPLATMLVWQFATLSLIGAFSQNIQEQNLDQIVSSQHPPS